MKLYMFIVAPNPTKVRLYLAEKALAGHPIELEEVMVDLRAGEQKSPEMLGRNPLGKLPILELDDGSVLTESLPIIEYLEEQFPDAPMIGTDPLERARVRELERLADIGVLITVARIVHATDSPLGLSANPAVADHYRAVLPQMIGLVDERLSDARPFVAGERPTIADCTLAAALQFARFGNVEIDSKFANVHRWDEAYRAREPAQKVLVG